MPKVLLIEFSDSHHECLYSQVRFLQESGCEVAVLVDKARIDRLEGYSCQQFSQDFASDQDPAATTMEIIEENRFDSIVYNTTSHGMVRRLTQYLHNHPEIRTAGILHNPKNIWTTPRHQLIRRKTKRFFLLSENLLTSIRRLSLQPRSYAYFYPMFFPDYQHTVQKPPGEIWIGVPGQVSQSRRDYECLLKSLLSINTDPSLRILFLGRLGDRDGKIPELIDRVNHQTPGLVRYWDKSIHNPEYHGYMQNIDAVLPLIHDRSFYRLKITGAFNLAFAYRKPLLLSAIMKNNIDFQDNAFFYANKDLGRVLSTPDKWLSAKYYTSEKWEFDFQRQLYIDHIFNSTT